MSHLSGFGDGGHAPLAHDFTHAVQNTQLLSAP
jgi:hypothetical protein